MKHSSCLTTINEQMIKFTFIIFSISVTKTINLFITSKSNKFQFLNSKMNYGRCQSAIDKKRMKIHNNLMIRQIKQETCLNSQAPEQHRGVPSNSQTIRRCKTAAITKRPLTSKPKLEVKPFNHMLERVKEIQQIFNRTFNKKKKKRKTKIINTCNDEIAIDKCTQNITKVLARVKNMQNKQQKQKMNIFTASGSQNIKKSKTIHDQNILLFDQNIAAFVKIAKGEDIGEQFKGPIKLIDVQATSKNSYVFQNAYKLCSKSPNLKKMKQNELVDEKFKSYVYYSKYRHKLGKDKAERIRNQNNFCN